MSRPAVIGIAGRARSGKDTVARFILAEIGGYTYSFADPIRGMMRALGIDLNDPYWQAHKEDVIPALGASPRRMMQTLGTDWGRQMINPDLWVRFAHQRLLSRGAGMIVPDVRFQNEADWVRRVGGRIIVLSRPDAPAVEDHVSENGVALDPSDAVLFNTGTLEELQQSVRDLLRVYN